MPKVLVISGQTATGKTKLAQIIAKKYSGELISVDSRQIYCGLNIGTGKDQDPKTKIHLIDILNPNQSFSAIDFLKQAQIKINKIQNKNRLPILVGGTGYYFHALLHPNSFHTPDVKKHFLFPVLNHLSVKKLQRLYCILSPLEFEKLNNSEKNNPHRLLKRILLVLSFRKKNKEKIPKPNYQYLHLHLTAPKKYLDSLIDTRISYRLKSGLLDEIKNLLNTYSWESPGLKTMAYQEFKPFFEEINTLDFCITTWTKNEKLYAKRQKTYFQKFFPQAQIFDISQKNYLQELQSVVDKWYNH